MKTKTQALKILEESIKEIENPKGSALTAIQKLARASQLLNNEEINAWCQIQLGNPRYIAPIKKCDDLILDTLKESETPNIKKEKELNQKLLEILEELKKMHIPNKLLEDIDDFNLRTDERGGGYMNIGFIEEKYRDLTQTKIGNDGKYYKNPLSKHIYEIKNRAHQYAVQLHQAIELSETVQGSFDVLKNAVNDKLLDFDATLGEKLIQTFKGISSTEKEEWSQALTTCRRLLKDLADKLYPPTRKKISGRKLGDAEYINRLWAYMDKSIESDTNKELAKSHIDYFGSWLEKTNKTTNKGVHSNLERLEAIKAVFHIYLVLADILEYLTVKRNGSAKVNINKASLDEIESLLNVKRSVAKEIIKIRAEQGYINLESLEKIKGIGPKTLEKALQVFSFESTIK